MSDTKTILVFIGSYIPGYRAGGPIRSIANLVEIMGDEVNFKIITADHDFGVTEPYPGISSDTWCKVGKADVYYASKKSLRFRSLARLINSIDYDVYYLNDFFCFDFTIRPLLLRYLKLVPRVATIVAPRGEFALGALKLKWFKKKLYMFFAIISGLYNDLVWQASSNFERDDILRVFKNGFVKISPPIKVAPDVGTYNIDKSKDAPKVKKSGALEITFLSRISREKNLDGALLMLKGLHGDITFNICGPVKDKRYFQACQDICNDFTPNIKVAFHGEVDHTRVQDVFRSHHLFFFPTLGENFGHVILESLLAGCPVLLSDQTPWRDLESFGVGWDLPLNRPDRFRAVLERCVDMDHDEFSKFSRCAADFGRSRLDDPEILEQNRNLFRFAGNVLT